MRRRVLGILAIVLGLGLGSSLSAAEWAEKMFEVKRHDFGRVPFGGKAEFEFPITNVNSFEVEIARLRVSCECTEPRASKSVLRPGEQGAIVVGLATSKYNGRKGATITVTFNRPSFAEVQLHVTSYIDKKIEVTPKTVELGTVDQGTAAEQQVTIRNSANPGWKIVEVRSSNPHIAGNVVETSRDSSGVSYRLRVRLDGSAPGGYFKDQLVLLTSDAKSAQLPVLVRGRVSSEIQVSPASLFMGVAAPGKTLTKVIVVRGRRPFRIRSVTCDAAGFEFAGVAGDRAKSLFLIPATFTAGTTLGKVAGTIRIETDPGGICDLPVQAIVAQ